MYFLTSTVLIGQLYPPQPITSPHHRITASPRHRVTTPPHHHITASPCHRVSHLPCPLPPSQSVICLAPCHQTSQSFALPPTTASLRHHITASPRHHVTVPPRHRVTALVSHLPCPLPPSQSVICLAPCHQASQSFALPPATKPVSHLPCPLPPRHRITASPHHRATASLPQIFPTTWVWIWLVNANQHSSDWLIVPTTANQITGIEKPNYHKTLIFFPHHLFEMVTWSQNRVTASPRHHATASPHHRATASLFFITNII